MWCERRSLNSTQAALAALAECCSSKDERDRLRWLASRQGELMEGGVGATLLSTVVAGSREYSKLIMDAHTDILDLLHVFPSCRPSLARIIGKPT